MALNLLTTFECQQMLTAIFGSDLLLKDFQIVPALDAHGYLGEYYRLSLNCEEANTQQSKTLKFFIKSIPQKSDEAEKTTIFEKEAKLYATLLAELQESTKMVPKWNSTRKFLFNRSGIWSPKAFYTRSDLIVLEDLNSLGYEICKSKTNTLKDLEMESLLRALATMHASSIIYETKKGIQIGQKYKDILNEITVSPKIAWFTTGLKTIYDLAKNHPKYQNVNVRNFIENDLVSHLERVYAMQEPSAKYRNVVCHRDPWQSNVLFHTETCHAILLDFQTARYCPPVIDVIFAMFLNLDSIRRIVEESKYLQFYYQRLTDQLILHKIDVKDRIDFLEFLKSYEEFKLFGYLYRAIAFTLINVPIEFVTNHYKYVDRSEKLLNYMQINTEFREQMEACIEELIEYVKGPRISVLGGCR